MVTYEKRRPIGTNPCHRHRDHVPPGTGRDDGHGDGGHHRHLRVREGNGDLRLLRSWHEGHHLHHRSRGRDGDIRHRGRDRNGPRGDQVPHQRAGVHGHPEQRDIPLRRPGLRFHGTPVHAQRREADQDHRLRGCRDGRDDEGTAPQGGRYPVRGDHLLGPDPGRRLGGPGQAVTGRGSEHGPHQRGVPVHPPAHRL